MTIGHRFVSAAVAGLMGAAAFVATPSVAGAAAPCMLGWSNVGPRTCAMADVGMAPVLTLGNGICVGVLVADGTAFDGPLWEYSASPGAVHSVELLISQGFSPLGEWAPTILACDVTAIIDWHNFDTGRSGSVSRYIPASNNSTHPMNVHLGTGPGRVRLTMRTDRPSIPVSTGVTVP
ncbi:hypothetical protein [Rhodococcus chondri]|uniref:Secreted protein n=1 Tax=Rhodococcus chondri TaxID=3065941 RepID=A0ABU7JVB7_9NOCA|nr:hypothetical protein [Rhodococcus sp. CC-R104]MEE2033464.1 hypothetical protein [Rhodococcus sp. CC-R104]